MGKVWTALSESSKFPRCLYQNTSSQSAPAISQNLPYCAGMGGLLVRFLGQKSSDQSKGLEGPILDPLVQPREPPFNNTTNIIINKNLFYTRSSYRVSKAYCKDMTLTPREKVAAAIVNFLQDDCTSFNKEDLEGIQVAISCIKHAYGLENLNTSDIPNLRQTFGVPRAVPVRETKIVTEAMRKEAEMHKAKGNEYLQAKQATEAEEEYTRALELDPENCIYYSNRAAAYMLLEEYTKAIDDCLVAITLDPNYAKGYSRLGAAHLALGETEQSIEAYSKAVELDSDNVAYHAALDKAKRKLVAPTKPVNNPPPSPSASNTPNTGGARSSPFGGRPGGFDLNSLLNNPEIMNMASQMMNNPDAMRNMLNNPNIAAMMQGMMGGNPTGSGPNLGSSSSPPPPPPAREEP